MKNFLLPKIVIRADISPVLWQFLPRTAGQQFQVFLWRQILFSSLKKREGRNLSISESELMRGSHHPKRFLLTLHI